MSEPGFLKLLLARPPRRLARFPELPLEQALGELRTLKEVLAQPAQAAPDAGEKAPPAPEETLGAGMASLATHVWRAKGKMTDPATGEPREESRRTFRHVEAAAEALHQLGVRVSDWNSQPFDAGLPLKVLSFQPTPGVLADTIIEVVRPAVFWNDRLLQVGEVVVGIPENPELPTRE